MNPIAIGSGDEEEVFDEESDDDEFDGEEDLEQPLRAPGTPGEFDDEVRAQTSGFAAWYQKLCLSS